MRSANQLSPPPKRRPPPLPATDERPTHERRDRTRRLGGHTTLTADDWRFGQGGLPLSWRPLSPLPCNAAVPKGPAFCLISLFIIIQAPLEGYVGMRRFDTHAARRGM